MHRAVIVMYVQCHKPSLTKNGAPSCARGAAAHLVPPGPRWCARRDLSQEPKNGFSGGRQGAEPQNRGGGTPPFPPVDGPPRPFPKPPLPPPPAASPGPCGTCSTPSHSVPSTSSTRVHRRPLTTQLRPAAAPQMPVLYRIQSILTMPGDEDRVDNNSYVQYHHLVL